jgi:hypothetical protein
MVVNRRRLIVAALGSLLHGCNAPAPPASTGGTTLPPGECGRGLLVIGTDYQSTNVSLLGLDASVLSASFVSSATLDAELSAPLSGDVVAPTMSQPGAELVLLDRYPAAVLTWVDVASAGVRAQLRVGTGFAANPQDYVEVAPDKAYVSRFEQNSAPGAEPFDLGSDLLVVDPRGPAIVRSVDLRSAVAGEAAAVLPRPNRMVLAGERLFVLLSPYSADFVDSADARLVTLDTQSDSIVDVLVLGGLQGCSGLGLAPDQSRLAVSCSGAFQGGTTPVLAQAGLAVLSIATGGAGSGGAGGNGAGEQGPTEIARYRAVELGSQPLGFAVDFVDRDRVLVTAFGRFAAGNEPAVQDALIEVDLASGQHQVLLRGQELPFSLGEVRCAAPCEGCFVADAEQGLLHRFVPGAQWLELEQSVAPAPEIGLPPRMVGRF